MRLAPLLAALPLALAACGGGAAEQPIKNVPIPVPAPPPPPAATELEPARESPPESGPARPTTFPKIAHDTLANGTTLDVVEAHALPIVQLRLVVKSGTASDGDLTGVARLTAMMLKDGGAGRYASRELLARIESLGADLGVEVGPDATVLSLAVAREHMDEALDLLGTVAREPRFDEGELAKLKKREIERVADRAKSSGVWAASMVLQRKLHRLPTGLHPYASFDALPAEIQKLGAQSCRDFYKKHYSPKNASLVVAGDVDVAAAKKGAERAFGAWKGGDVEPPAFGEAMPPAALEIVVADRPHSAQSDVFVGMLGPARRDDDWTTLKVANQVLGGGVAGRLFLDVREKRSLAYNTRSTLGEVAHGPVSFTAYAGTQTAKTGLAVEALLDNLKRLASEPASDEEMNTARRYLADVFALRMETIGSVADMVVSLDVLGLPDDYYDTYRKALGAVTAADAEKVAAEHVRDGHAIVVVAGDAATIAPMLAHFGEVTIVDPQKGFEREKTVPANPSAPLELPRESGR